MFTNCVLLLRRNIFKVTRPPLLVTRLLDHWEVGGFPHLEILWLLTLIYVKVRKWTCEALGRLYPQSTQRAGPVRFLIFCSISIFLVASLVAGKGLQYSAGTP
jgi:hypothetical protein